MRSLIFLLLLFLGSWKGFSQTLLLPYVGVDSPAYFSLCCGDPSPSMAFGFNGEHGVQGSSGRGFRAGGFWSPLSRNSEFASGWFLGFGAAKLFDSKLPGTLTFVPQGFVEASLGRRLYSELNLGFTGALELSLRFHDFDVAALELPRVLLPEDGDSSQSLWLRFSVGLGPKGAGLVQQKIGFLSFLMDGVAGLPLFGRSAVVLGGFPKILVKCGFGKLYCGLASGFNFFVDSKSEGDFQEVAWLGKFGPEFILDLPLNLQVSLSSKWIFASGSDSYLDPTQKRPSLKKLSKTPETVVSIVSKFDF